MAICRARSARSAGATFFTGEDALREVAKDDGMWNWALVVADPQELPLVGGGRGGAAEMRDVIGRHAHVHIFGLLRMTFGARANARTEFMFVHVSDPNAGECKAVGTLPDMEQAVRKFAATAASLHLESQEDCTVERFVEKLRSTLLGIELDTVTVENLKAAEEQKRQADLEELQAPTASVIEPRRMTLAASFTTNDTTSQRKKLKLFRKGDVVEVYSSKHQTWYEDAEVVDVVKETTVLEGIKVRAGSMKVVYSGGSRFKWVTPQQMGEVLRPSPRPKAPPIVGGLLSTEVNSWFSTAWTQYYFELNKGFLQCWNSLVDAKAGYRPKRSIHLLGLGLQEQDTCIRLQSDALRGAVYTVRAETEADTGRWAEALWDHAGFCEEMREFSRVRQGGSVMRKQLLQVVPRHASLAGA